MRLKIKAEQIDFPFSTDKVRESGVYADFDREGNLTGMELWVHGRKTMQLTLQEDGGAHCAEIYDFDVSSPQYACNTPHADGRVISEAEFDALSEAEQEKAAYEQGLWRWLQEGPFYTMKMLTSEENVTLCGFCQKTNREVQTLIAGRKVCICNECVAVCNDILAA